MKAESLRNGFLFICLVGGEAVRISQCMIVKNEENNIAKALSWGKEVVWEQIVVDTGSTDRTVEIAKSMGAKTYYFEWIDDFAAAKNFAIHKAEGDWIIFLDADEFFTPEDAEYINSLLEQLSSTGTEAVATGCLNLGAEGKTGSIATQIRIFKNKPSLRYKRRIHEQLLAEEGKREMCVADATQILTFFHTGYAGEVFDKKRTGDRNLRLIKEELKEHPENYEMLGYLGDEYRAMDCLEEAVIYYWKAIEAMPAILDERDSRSAATFSYLLEILIQEGSPDKEIENVYQKASALLPGEGDFAYLAGRHFASKGKYGRAIEYLQLALGKLDEFGTNNRSMILQAHIQDAYEIMAICFLNLKDFQRSIEYSTAILRYSPYSMSALITLLKSLKGDSVNPLVSACWAADFLLKIYDKMSVKDQKILMTAAKENQWPDLERELADRFENAETGESNH